MKAGIVIDEWKLPIFKRHLKDAGYNFTQGWGVGADTLTLYVEADDLDVSLLENVVRAANVDARKAGPYMKRKKGQ